MPIEYKEPPGEEDVPFAFLFLASLSVLFLYVVLPAVFRKIGDVIRQRNQSAVAWSNKIALIVASNRRDSYEAEKYCTICFSPASHRCSNCRAVAYCSKKCQRDHGKQGHWEECVLMGDIEAIANEAKGQEKDESNMSQDESNMSQDELNKDYLAMAYSPLKPSLWFWPELDIFSLERNEKDHQIRYLAEECQPFVGDAGESAKVASEFDAFPLDPEHPSAFDSENCIPKHSCVNHHSLSKGCCSDCEVVFHCSRHCQRHDSTNVDQEIALENGCYNSCVAILSCSKHCQRNEWISGHKLGPQLVLDDVGETSSEASEFKHSISHAQTIAGSETDDQSPRRVIRRHPAAIRRRYPTSERSSSSRSTDSSCASCSMDATGSDAVSSLHGLD